MIAGMLWSDVPCGKNSCYNSTLENRWQFSNQKEQVNIDCSSCSVDSCGLQHHTFLGMFLKHIHTGFFSRSIIPRYYYT